MNLKGSVYSERGVGDQHYVCVVNPDQQNPERVRGFPVEIDVEEGENDAGENIFDDDDDSGNVPPPKSHLCLLLCAGKNRIQRLKQKHCAKEPAQQREIWPKKEAGPDLFVGWYP